MKKILAMLVLICIGYTADAGGPEGTPEGEIIVANLADSSKVNALNELFKQHFRSDPELARKYGEEALSLAQEINYLAGIYKMTNNLGVLHSNQGNYDTALVYHREGLEYFRKANQPGKIANSLVNIGGVKFSLGQYDSALQDYQEAYGNYFAAQDTEKAMHVLNNVGAIYQDQGRLGEALSQFLTVLDFQEKKKDSLNILTALINVGAVYQLRSQYEDAEKLYTRALNISQKTGDKYGILNATINLARVWGEVGKHEAALDLHKKAEVLAVEVNDQYGLAENYIGLAMVYSALDEPDSAAYMARQAKSICSQIGRRAGVSHALIILGELQIKDQKSFQAIENLNHGIAIADSIGHNSLLRDGYNSLSTGYSELGKFKEAYAMKDSFLKYNEIINSQKNNDRISELRAKYAAGEQEKAISKLQLQTAADELKISKSSRRATLLLAGLTILLIIALALFMRFRQKNRLAELIDEQRNHSEAQRKKVEAQNKQIREINSNLERMIETRTHAVRAAKEELDVFLYQSAHALRRPLVRVEGLVSLIVPKLTDPGDQVLVEKLNITIEGMDDLLHKLVTTNEIQRCDPELEPINFHKLTEEVAQKFDWTNAELSIDIPTETQVVADDFLLRTILDNTLQNALQYRLTDPKHKHQVTVSLEETDIHTIIHVTDNGRGIPEGESDKVFDMFYRADHLTRGSGLGLYVVLKTAEKLHGTTFATAMPSGGTRITVEFPRHIM